MGTLKRLLAGIDYVKKSSTQKLIPVITSNLNSTAILEPYIEKQFDVHVR